jgi:hypothetical protein
MSQNYFDNETSGFRQGLSNIATALTRAPQIRAAQAQQQAQFALQQQREAALEQETGARTRLATTQGDIAQQNLKGMQELSAALMRGMEQTPRGDYVIKKEAIGDVMSKLPLISKGAGDFGSGFANVIKTQNAGPDADEKAQATLEQALAVQSAKPWAAPGGSTVMQGTNIVGQAAANVPAGNVRTAPAEGIAPAAVAVNNPGAPKSSAVENTRARFISKLLDENSGMDAKSIMAKLKAFDAQTGYKGDSSGLPANPLASALSQGSDESETPQEAASETPQDEAVEHPSGMLEQSIKEERDVTPVAQQKISNKIPAEHAQWLITHATPQNIASFEKTYGKGSAAKVLGK